MSGVIDKTTRDGSSGTVAQRRAEPEGNEEQLRRDIALLRRLVEARSEEHAWLQALIDAVPDHLWVKDVSGAFVVANLAVASDCGRASAQQMIGLTDFDIHLRERAENNHEIEGNIFRTGNVSFGVEEPVVDAAGVERWYSMTRSPLRNGRGEIVGLVGVGRDVTERRRAAELREGQAHILEMIAVNAPLEDVLEHLMRLTERQLNGIFCSTLLLEKDGLHVRHGAAPSLDPAYRRAVDGSKIGPKAGSCGTAMFRREPVIVTDILTDPLWEDYRDLAARFGFRSCWSTPILSHHGEPRGAFAMYSQGVRAPTAEETRLIEVTARFAGIAVERKEAEDRIRFMVNHDALTGLPNRALLKDRLAQAMLFAQRYDRWVTVAFIELDNFKLVNDSLGHGVGDELLKIIADRLVASMRTTDTVARLGANEFVTLFFDQPKSAEIVPAVLQRLRDAISAPVMIHGRNLQVTSSIGLANYPKDGMDAETLLANAGAAMYRAKEISGDNFQYYTPELNTKVHEKFLLQEELREAVARQEFVLHYQPQVDLRDGRIFAVEALIRWNHPTLGLVPPGKFIPIAEETGLIEAIGDWVLHKACKQNKAWQDAGLAPVNVSVNVSARQFKETDWVCRVVSALRESGLEARYLELELTESLIMQDVDQAVATMKELQALGVQLSIDDFGTGYSSLSALKTLPVARLKIDKSFVRDLPHDENDRAVATAVISLAQKLNLRVIAEGVETEEQMTFLRENNCDEMQGYLFSRPIEATQMEQLLRRRPTTRYSLQPGLDAALAR